MSLSLPWWAIVYLLLAVLIFSGGAYDDFKKSKLLSFLNLLSLSFVILFVVGFFNIGFLDSLSWFIIPMAFFGVIFEFYAVMKDTKEMQVELAAHSQRPDKQDMKMLNLILFLNGLIVVPGYLAGIKLCMDLFK